MQKAIYEIDMNELYGDSIISGIQRAQSKGYISAFRFENGKLIDRESGKIYSKLQCILDQYERFEGMSDPADSSILFLIQCYDGKKGYLSGAYGIYANTELFDFMKSLKNKNTFK